MLERSELTLKIACALLAALLLYQLSRAVSRWNPLAHSSIPALPTLPADPEPGSQTTNSVTAPIPRLPQPNPAASGKPGPKETNSISTRQPVAPATNAASPPPAGRPETNSAAAPKSRAADTNSSLPNNPPRGGPGPAPRPGALLRGPDLPLPVQARLERVIQSEILAPVMRPLPMALLGIAGDNAFLRAPNGQTGLIKEGSELGGIKLLRIGTNRVLVEQEGQPKELTIFSGYGSESLLPQPTAKPQ